MLLTNDQTALDADNLIYYLKNSNLHYLRWNNTCIYRCRHNFISSFSSCFYNFSIVY